MLRRTYTAVARSFRSTAFSVASVGAFLALFALGAQSGHAQAGQCEKNPGTYCRTQPPKPGCCYGHCIGVGDCPQSTFTNCSWGC